MARASRAKGVAGEREVARLYEDAGFQVRGLEATGDHLVCKPGSSVHAFHDVWIHSEVKRQERLQLWSWLEQARTEAPDDTVPVVSFRRNRGEWYACLPLRDLLRLV